LPGDTLYTGSWNGTFDVEWTCNPAWILYDLCTDDRYGLGQWLSANQMDKWSLYEIGKYCDAVDNSGKFTGVDDGWGNKEARFACNLYLQGREEAFKVLNDISSIFRGMIYWQQGQVSAVQDAPKDPVMNFSDANVIDGTFTYEGTSRKQRHNVAHVTWNNPEDFYRKNVEYVEDAPGIVNANNQIFSVDVIAVGCTSQGQARRVGKWILYTERYETETITFTTGMEGAVVRPGDIIKVADSHKAGIRYGGRTAAGSTTTTIKLDAPTSVTAGKLYKLSIINTEEACVQSGVKQSETTQETCLNANVDNEWKPYVWVETKDVSTIGTTEAVTEIVVTSAFANTPTTEYMWILEEMGSVEAQDFRVLITRESGPNLVEISGLKYHEAKYGYIEENIAFSSKSTSSLPNPSDPIPSPSNLTISEELYIDSMGNVKNRAEFSWDAPKTAGTSTTYPYIASYYVEWRRKAPAITNWTSIGETSAQSIVIDDAPAGTLEFRVKTRRIF
jgi:predicted phage tail protein